MSRGEQASGIRISYSSSNTFQGCQRKFYYEKVVKTDIDPDVEVDTKALRLGKAYHAVLEYCEHDFKKLDVEHFKKAYAENSIATPTEQGLILAMVRKYLDLHEKSGLKVVGIEIKIGNEVDYIGFIDVVLVDKNGYWWICDLKTAARLSNFLLSRLSRDPQLNVYSHFAKDVAEECGLDLDKFMGVRYRVTTKASIKCGPKESVSKFADRCSERLEAYDIGIPREELIPSKVYDRFMVLLDQMRSLEEMDEEEVPQNFTYCETYFKPCQYWSKCYGKTFTANAEQHEIYDTDNMGDLTVELNDDDLDFL